MLLKNAKHKYQNQAAEGGEGGGGFTITPEIQAIIDGKIEEAVVGLKAKNGNLIASEKKLKEALAPYDGIDPVATRNMMKQFTDSEEAGLMAAGKVEEAFKRRNERKDAETEKQFNALKGTIEQLNAKASKLAAGTVSNAIVSTAANSGVEKDKLHMVPLIAEKHGWTIDDTGEVISMRGGEVVLGKDGATPLKVKEWVESLRDDPQYSWMWPKAQGSGAQGSGTGGANGVKTMTRTKYMALSPVEQSATVKAAIKIID